MYKIVLMSLLVVLYTLIQVLFLKKIKVATDKIEYHEKEKHEIYSQVYSLYGFHTAILFIVLVQLILL